MKNPKRFYGKGIPGVDPAGLKGTLIVLEGSDGAGRTTQISLLSDWLQKKGYATVIVGLKRSELVGEALREAMRGHTLMPTTLSLFYATDLADQLELAARVSPRGMVLANEFVRDGFSPLYDSWAPRTVTEVAREVQDALAVWQTAEAIAA